MFNKFGCFSATSDTKKPIENITELFRLNNDRDCAAIILCSHDGTEVSKLILDDLKTTLRSSVFTNLTDCSEIKHYLKNIFISFDKKYLKDADQYLRKRSLLNERLSKVELDVEIEVLYKSLEDLERISKCGCTLSLAIILNETLYIAHLGDNQIIVALDGEMSGEHKFILLTEEHNFYNESEILRIKNDCELNANGLSNLYGKSFAKYHSRCLGHYEMKCEYMQLETFRNSKVSPIICLPQITDCLKMSSKWCHLLFVSSGLYYLVMELIYDRDKIAGEIANEFIMTKKLNPNKDLSEICELVIDKYLSIYKAAFDEDDYLGSGENSKIDHEELTIMAIKLSISETKSTANGGKDLIKMVENGTNILFDNPGSNFPFPYLSFDTWTDAESKLSNQEHERFDLIFSLTDNATNLILEEESSSSMRFSRTDTLDELVVQEDDSIQELLVTDMFSDPNQESSELPLNRTE